MQTVDTDIASVISGYSKPLYSTWVFYKPDNLLLDCGEGAATTLDKKAFAVDRILLTHGHSDHISGIQAFLWSRASTMGDTLKPLTIYYPKDHGLILELKNYLSRTFKYPPYRLEWAAVEPNQEIELSAGRKIKVFQNQHIRGEITVSYKILETRKRLRPEFSKLSPEDIKLAVQKAKSTGAQINEEYTANIMSWSGDTRPLSPTTYKNAAILMHEATILENTDRKGNAHSTLLDAMDIAVKAEVKNLVLYHISCRYSQQAIKDKISSAHEKCNGNFPVWVLYKERLFRVI